MATNECSTELQSLKHRANYIGILEAYSRTKNIQQQQDRRSIGGFSDLKGNQLSKPPRKYGSRMPSVERC